MCTVFNNEVVVCCSVSSFTWLDLTDRQVHTALHLSTAVFVLREYLNLMGPEKLASVRVLIHTE